MRPAPFAYYQPRDIEALLSRLTEAERPIAILAGGQSLVAAMSRRERTPASVIDINRVAGMDAIAEDQDGSLRVRACARLEAVRRHPFVFRSQPLLVQGLSFVANPAVRLRGTLVGNLVNNAPGCEMSAVALALDASFVLLRPDRDPEHVTAARFLSEPLPEGAFVSDVVFPARAAGSRSGFVEVARRPYHVCVVGVAVETGPATTAIALAGYGWRAFRCRRAEAKTHYLLGRGLLPAPEMLRSEIMADARECASVASVRDLDYREDVAPGLVCDALSQAMAEAR